MPTLPDENFSRNKNANMKNRKSQAMTLTLCLEDNTGRDTNLEVRPNDDFATFLERAKKILGYAPRITDITEGEAVSLEDNIYRFLIEAEMNKDAKKESEPDPEPERSDGVEEEFGEVEYLTEDEEELLAYSARDESIKSRLKRETETIVERERERESEEFAETEYLEEDSDEPGVVDVEILDSSLEEDDSDEPTPKRRRLGDDRVSESEQIYTTKELLDVLENSSGEEGDLRKRKDRAKIKNGLGSKRAESGPKRDEPTPKDAKRRKLADGAKKPSPFDLAMLKRTVRQPTVNLSKVDDAKKEPSTRTPPFDVSRYIPSNYEDVDNEGVYDYFEDANDLLTETKSRPVSSKTKKTERDDVVKAVDGINKMMGLNKKRTPGKRPRGRPKKVLGPANEDDRGVVIDTHTTYLDSVVKSEPIDDEDDDYVPGKSDLDWLRNKKREKYNCRMCSTSFTRLSLAISHALSHRVPRKAVFPCILCAYGFTTYSELQKHMKTEHRKKKSPSKKGAIHSAGPSAVSLSKTRGRPKKHFKTPVGNKLSRLFEPEPEPVYGDIEIMDDEEVCNVEMLEEWVDDDEEEEIERPESETVAAEEPMAEVREDSKRTSDKENLKMEETSADEDEYQKQVNKTEELDFTASGDDEWLLDEGEEEAARMSDDSDAVNDSKTNLKRKKRKPKLKKYKCNICLCCFDSHNMLLNHKCNGAKEKLRGTRGAYRCALCGRTFRSRLQLVLHRSFHQVELLEKKQTCNYCPERKFPSEADLFDHINNEHNVDFVCTEPGCYKEFHLRSALRAHSRLHGKKTYQCQECGKQFYDIHNLKEHNVTHLAVKPFQCHLCLKYLNRRSRLRMHLIAHESSPVENCVLACKFCKMAFRDAIDAEAHVMESEDCRKGILAGENVDLLSALENLNEDEDEIETNNTLMDGMNEDMINETTDENSQAEATVDDIVNKTLVESGIIPLSETNQNANVASSTVMLSDDESLRVLLAGGVKLMLNVDENGHILEESRNSIPSEVASIKDLLSNVGTIMEPLTETTIKRDAYIHNNASDSCDSTFKENSIETEESLNNEQIKIENDTAPVKPQRLMKNKQIFTEEELMSQLKESTKFFVTVVKIKVAYRCEYCEKNYYTKEALNTHRVCHDGLRNPFICNVCNAAFSTFARCTSHKTTHGFFKLNIEDEKDEKDENDISHYEMFPVIKYFLCQHCNKTFLHWTYLQVHRRHKHSKNTYYFNCRFCGEKFTDSWSLNSHRRKMHADSIQAKKSSNTSYKCADCGEGYNKRIELAKHRQEVHSDPSLLEMKNKPGLFACTLCDKVYQTKLGLDGHMRTHSGDDFVCDHCGNKFAHRTALETHYKRMHASEKNRVHVCRTCGQNFRTSDDYYAHRRCHTGEKPFQCEYCPMSFRTKGRRNEHHRTHTGERPYKCDICGVAFRRSNSMKNHRLIHTGDKRHACPHCRKLFHVYSNLKTHIKIKHPGVVLLEIDDEKSIKILNDDSKIITTDVTSNEQVLVLQDVIIKGEDETILPDDGTPSLMGYTYETDITANAQGTEISSDTVQYVDGTIIDGKDANVHIQLLNANEHEQGLLYAVEDPSGGGDMQLISGGVRYTLVDDISDDHKPQFTIIDSHQFVKEEDVKSPVYYT